MVDQVREPGHIVVVGLMGAGKTTVGRALADALGRPHRDSDGDIEASHGRTAREIAAADGVDALHELELRQLLDALDAPVPSVISAAASTIDAPAGVAALRRPDVVVVWLRIDPGIAAARAARGSHRPSPEPMTAQAMRRDPAFAGVADVTVDGAAPLEHILADALAVTR